MPEYVKALICLMIVIMSVIATSLVKILVKKIAEKDGEALDHNKFEYLFAGMSFIMSALCIFWFVRMIVGITDPGTIAKYIGLYSGSTQGVYLFIVQLFRKGWKGVISILKNVFSKVKASNNPMEELPSIVNDVTSSITTTNNTVKQEQAQDDISKFRADLQSIINNNLV